MIDPKRQTLSLICALAIQELFPGVELIAATGTLVGFCVDFFAKEEIGKAHLDHIETRMKEIMGRKLDVRQMRMIPKVAASYLKECNLRYLAEQVGEGDSLLQALGSHFAMPSRGSYEVQMDQLFPFQMWTVEEREGRWRVIGVAFEDAMECKRFLKSAPELIDWDSKSGLFANGGWTVRGERVREELRAVWERLTPERISTAHLEEETLLEAHRKSGMYGGELAYRLMDGGFDGLKTPLAGWTDIFCIACDQENIEQKVISSLQRIEETFKILGFSPVVRLRLAGHLSGGSKKIAALLEKVCDRPIREECDSVKTPTLVWSVYDRIGLEWELSSLRVDAYQKEWRIVTTLFKSMERIVVLQLENGSRKIENKKA